MKHLLACALLTSAFCTNAQWSSSYADVDQDGCIGVGDVLEVLSLFGDCSATWQCGDTLEYDNYWYETVLIGDQCWFAENLRTPVYGNGDTIPTGLSNLEWGTTAEGATAIFGEGGDECSHSIEDFNACNNDSLSLLHFGRLYNHMAVLDIRGLCPTGWHVPSWPEFLILEEFVCSYGFACDQNVYQDSVGVALKSVQGWAELISGQSGNGIDFFGFTAIPGGRRYGQENGQPQFWGIFDAAGSQCTIWSSTKADPPNDIQVWVAQFSANTTNLINTTNPRHMGYSVRCLKNTE